jgi:hypothetical protein
LLILVEPDAIQKSVVQVPIFHVTSVQESDGVQFFGLDEVKGVGGVGLR